MTNKRTSSLEDLARELNKDPNFRKAYRTQRPYYALISEVINCRKRLGLTQKELAKKADMHQSTVSRIESADHDIRLSTLIKLAEALDSFLDVRFVSIIEEEEFQEVGKWSSSPQRTVQVFSQAPGSSYGAVELVTSYG